MNLGKEVIKNEDDRRIKGDDEGSGDETDRVDKVHHLKGHKACGERKKKKTVGKFPERLVIKTLSPFPLPEENSVKKVNGCAHRAEPSAKEVAENQNEEKDTKGREHSQNEPFFRENRNDSDEGIESQIEIDRNFRLKRKGSSKDEIEKESNGEGLDRPPQVRDRPRHVALTFLTRTFERSIWPNPNS